MTATSDGTAPDGVVAARRPVVDRDRRLIGYELVYDAPVPTEGWHPSAAGGVVAVHELLHAHDSSLEDVVGDKLAFCHVDRDLLVGESPLMLRPRQTVLQVRTGEETAGLREGCAWRRTEGYTVALDDPVLGDGVDQLLGAVDLVQVDLARRPRDQVLELVERCRDHPVRLHARGCRTEADLAWALDAGFDLFQGRAVRAPAIPASSSIAPSAVSQVQLGVMLLSADLDLDQIEEVLLREPALVVQVLDLAAAGRRSGMRRQVRSIREAMVVLGTRRLQRWVAVTVLGRHGRLDTDALLTGLVRARMCELLARERGFEPAFAFTAGLLSTLDLVLGVTFDEIEQQLEIAPDLVAAAFRREGGLGELVTDVARYQEAVDAGDRREPLWSDLGPVGATAFCWATGLVHAMTGGGD